MFFILLLVSLLPLGAVAQQVENARIDPPEQLETTPTFKSGVANVRVDVQVTEKNELVTDLTAPDFLVFDERKPQTITYFGREAEPLSLILLLDVSGSMRKYIEEVAAVARQALRYLRPVDRVAVMVFGRTSKVRLDFTDSPSAVADDIREAVHDESIGLATNINDALAAAAKHMDDAGGESGRRAVLIITDNEGLNEKHRDDSVIAAYEDANTVLNSIVVGNGRRPSAQPPQTKIYRNPDFTPADVFKIAEQTGGEAVKAAEAGKAFNRMIERIRTRYSLHYHAPESAPPGFRRLEVRLTPEATARYPKAELRHRRGYRIRN
jgi:VWFA-related protein